MRPAAGVKHRGNEGGFWQRGWGNHGGRRVVGARARAFRSTRVARFLPLWAGRRGTATVRRRCPALFHGTDLTKRRKPFGRPEGAHAAPSEPARPQRASAGAAASRDRAPSLPLAVCTLLPARMQPMLPRPVACTATRLSRPLRTGMDARPQALVHPKQRTFKACSSAAWASRIAVSCASHCAASRTSVSCTAASSASCSPASASSTCKWVVKKWVVKQSRRAPPPPAPPAAPLPPPPPACDVAPASRLATQPAPNPSLHDSLDAFW